MDTGDVYDCTCSYLTDFDDPSKQEVTICSPSAERAPAIARGCAQSGAPAPVQSCACRTVPKQSCKLGDCRLR